MEMLLGVGRSRDIAWPRQEAYALAWDTGRYSMAQIGRYFGDRDHTTVLHGIRRHKERQASSSRARP